MRWSAAVRGLAGRVWYGGHWLGVLLSPLSAVYRVGLNARRLARRRLPAKPLAVPVVVVGNLTVGGTGKTPLVIHLAKLLQARGRRVGVVSRGYRARVAGFPHRVGDGDDAFAVGDEPKLIAQETGCPVVIAPRRREAALVLARHCDVEVVLSDDGLQHSALPRALEIVVVDGDRKFGNGRLLPAGPLREPVSRLDEVDYVVVNVGGNAGAVGAVHGDSANPVAGGAGADDAVVNVGGNAEAGGDVGAGGADPSSGAPQMSVRLSSFRHLVTGRREPVGHFGGQSVHACAGIGNPRRFFDSLACAGIEVRRHEFPDHHAWRVRDLLFDDGLPVVMTAKDGVKCAALAHSGAEALQPVWIAETETRLDAGFEKTLLNRIEALIHG
ncbi:MAG: tetraacyldisaccharide 4'-kinase [Gammaproteobacteria bacterium]|nr:tetraacyldisaccharide 4'-kinase [Gammaproteobacteria bacterium]